MNIIGQHLLMDIYTSPKAVLNDAVAIQNIISSITEELGIPPLGIQCQSVTEDEVLCFLLFSDGQMVLRTYPQYRYVAVDFFATPEFPHEKIFIRLLKNHLLAEKTKITHIKRGDRGTIADMKPKTNTSSGPIRRVKDTSKKMMGLLKRKQTDPKNKK
jgi:S-adenosylmethionine decarboxylase